MHYKYLLFVYCLFSVINNCIAEKYVSIKSTTNLRVGPGKQYPINWTLNIQNMPVKMLEKGEVYSKVELYDGTSGWIWNATISKKKSVIVLKDEYIYNKKRKNIAFVKKNVVLNKIKCGLLVKNIKSCKISIQNIKGYINQIYVWGSE